MNRIYSINAVKTLVKFLFYTIIEYAEYIPAMSLVFPILLRYKPQIISDNSTNLQRLYNV